MTPEQAKNVVRVMAAAWPDGTWNDTAVRIWTDDLTDLDEGTAGTALARLRKTWRATGKQTHPSLSEFMDTYKAVDTYRPPERHDCDRCDGTGWEYTTTADASGNQWPAVAPCKCSNGRTRDGVYAGIRKTNETAA